MKPASFFGLAIFVLNTFAYSQFAREIHLSTATAMFVGKKANDLAGHHVSIIGDINNDKFDDFILTAPGWDQNENSQNNGAIYLFYGSSVGYNGTIDLTIADAQFIGAAGQEASHDVFGIGDIDNDGYNDFAIGIKKYSSNIDGITLFRLGKVYIFFGSSTKFIGTISLENADASLEGTNAEAEAAHLKGVGDVNNDGYDDIIVGAGFHSQVGPKAGKVYLFLGKDRAEWTKNAKMEQVADASYLAEAANDRAGHRVSGVGDVNNDGYTDFIIGADLADSNGLIDNGKVYLFLGTKDGWKLNTPLTEADASWIGNSRKLSLGWNVASAGDVDGDGLSDILIGGGAYKTFLIFGKNLIMSPNQSIDSAADVTFIPSQNLPDDIGHDIHSLGDLNGDTLDDFIIGGSKFTDSAIGAEAGKSFIFWGRQDWPSEIEFDDADVIFTAEQAGDAAGFSTTGNGDINNDGKPDLLISAFHNDDNGVDAGKIYLFLNNQPTLTLIHPNGGEVLIADSQSDILWSNYNFDENIKIELSVDGGKTWDNITPDAENSGSYIWSVPNRPTTNAFIRIAGSPTSSIFDISDAAFTISGSSLSYTRIEEVDATLADGYIVEERSETSNGKVARLPVQGSTTGTMTYNFDLPPAEYELFIRYLDESDGVSTSVINVNGNKIAEWTWNTAVASDIYIYRSVGTYTFNTDDEIQMWTLRNGGEYGRIDYFEFVRPDGVTPNIRIISPNGGESWPIDSSQNITWRAENTSSVYNVQLSRNGGAAWENLASNITIHPAADSTITLNIANVTGPASDNCRIQVADANGSTSDISDAAFSIIESTTPIITVTSPNGGETWMTGAAETMTWNSKNTSGKVKIELSRNAGSSWVLLTENTPDDGDFEWMVTVPPSDVCLIRITDVTSIASDTSDAVFRIKGTPKITLLAPNGGEMWDIGSNENIRWNSEFVVGNVAISLSRDNGDSWQTISDNAPNNGAFVWLVSQPETSSALFSVSALDGSTADSSDALFTIVAPPSIKVTSPNGGEKWQIGETNNITWESVKITGVVKIQISRNNGQTWESITDAAENSGALKWTVTGPATNQGLVKISSADDAVSDACDDIFAITERPQITVTSPNGGEKWTIGATETITWTSVNTSGAIKIELSQDAGATWESIIDSTADDGSFSWTITTPASPSCLIKASDIKGQPSDTSDAPFAVLKPLEPTITVISPNGAEKWVVGSTQKISWFSQDLSEKVKIELSRNNGVTWETVAEAVTDSGAYDWTVTGAASNSCFIKVSDISGSPFDLSNSAFRIVEKTSLAVKNPNGGEVWDAGSEQEIIWESTNGGSIIRIELSRDNGSTWEQLVADAANTGQWTWLVTLPISEVCLIRLTDVQNVVSDKSDAVFQIDDPTGITHIMSENPADFVLEQNYPNPFNPETRIQYQLPTRSDVRLSIYNIQGSRIATLVDGMQAAGTYTLMWNGKDDNGHPMPSGVYIYKISADGFLATKRMMLMK